MIRVQEEAPPGDPLAYAEEHVPEDFVSGDPEHCGRDPPVTVVPDGCARTFRRLAVDILSLFCRSVETGNMDGLGRISSAFMDLPACMSGGGG